MTVLIAGLVALDVVMLGGAIRTATRSRRTRRPSAADADPADLADADDAEHTTSTHHPAAGAARRSSPRRWINRAMFAAGISGAAALGGPLLPLVVIATVVGARALHRLARHRRIREHIERSTPDAVELLVLLIHAGLTPVNAVREMAAIAPPATRGGFAAVVHRLERGEPFSDALTALPRHLGPSMVALADMIGSADRNGSPLAPLLESLAHEARAARRRQHEAAARRLPVRLSFPLVACTLPSFVLLAIAPAVIAALSSLSLSV